MLKSAKATGGRKVQKRGKRFECTIGAQCREEKERENSTVYAPSLSPLSFGDLVLCIPAQNTKWLLKPERKIETSKDIEYKIFVLNNK